MRFSLQREYNNQIHVVCWLAFFIQRGTNSKTQEERGHLPPYFSSLSHKSVLHNETQVENMQPPRKAMWDRHIYFRAVDSHSTRQNKIT